MKQLLFAVAALATSLGVSAAGLDDIKTVYLMPMSNGLDQYLAVQLTTRAVMQVAIDPQKADAVLTDHLGESFEQSLADLNGPKPQSFDKDKAEDTGATFARSGMQGQRGRGNIFLVNRKTHDVLWSFYEFPKDKTPDGLKRIAGRISGKLAQSIKSK
jgi:hypothetical protein